MPSTALTVALYTVIGSKLTPLTAPLTNDLILHHHSCHSAALQVHLSYFQPADLFYLNGPLYAKALQLQGGGDYMYLFLTTYKP